MPGRENSAVEIDACLEAFDERAAADVARDHLRIAQRRSRRTALRIRGTPRVAFHLADGKTRLGGELIGCEQAEIKCRYRGGDDHEDDETEQKRRHAAPSGRVRRRADDTEARGAAT